MKIIYDKIAAEAMVESDAVLGRKLARQMDGQHWLEGIAMAVRGEPVENCWNKTQRVAYLSWQADEKALMDKDLADIRAGVIPMMRLTKAQMDEIENDRIGD